MPRILLVTLSLMALALVLWVPISRASQAREKITTAAARLDAALHAERDVRRLRDALPVASTTGAPRGDIAALVQAAVREAGLPAQAVLEVSPAGRRACRGFIHHHVFREMASPVRHGPARPPPAGRHRRGPGPPPRHRPCVVLGTDRPAGRARARSRREPRGRGLHAQLPACLHIPRLPTIPLKSDTREHLTMTLRILLILGSCALTSSLPGGCAAPRGPYSPLTEADRNPLEAQRISMEAAAILDALNAEETIPVGARGYQEQREHTAEQLARAESLLKLALTADLYCGPAHNNLGVVYLMQSPPRLYEAAGELTYCAKLRPGDPGPRVNLAMVFERAGKFDDACSNYRSALESSAGCLPAMQGLARLQLKHRRADDRTPEYLREIAERSDPQWREWARKQLARVATPSRP